MQFLFKLLLKPCLLFSGKTWIILTKNCKFQNLMASTNNKHIFNNKEFYWSCWKLALVFKACAPSIYVRTLPVIPLLSHTSATYIFRPLSQTPATHIYSDLSLSLRHTQSPVQQLPHQPSMQKDSHVIHKYSYFKMKQQTFIMNFLVSFLFWQGNEKPNIKKLQNSADITWCKWKFVLFINDWRMLQGFSIINAHFFKLVLKIIYIQLTKHWNSKLLGISQDSS